MLMTGGSSGSAMYCALQAAADFQLTAEHRVVVVLPDSIRNYMYVSIRHYVQGHRSIWDRGDTSSPQYLDWGDIITNAPLKISRVISATFYPCNIFLIS